MQVPTIDDCRLLMSWVSSPANTQLHTAARRVCLAVHHWSPEPTAVYAAALVDANQVALQQATDDPLGVCVVEFEMCLCLYGVRRTVAA